MVTQRPILEREPSRRIEVGAERGLRETLAEGCRTVWTKTRDLLTGARDAIGRTDRAVEESVDQGPEEPRFEFTQPVRTWGPWRLPTRCTPHYVPELDCGWMYNKRQRGEYLL